MRENLCPHLVSYAELTVVAIFSIIKKAINPGDPKDSWTMFTDTLEGHGEFALLNGGWDDYLER